MSIAAAGSGQKGSAWKLNPFQLVAYAAPNFALSVLIVPASAILPTLYAKERGLELALMGTILFAARVFDAITDQLIGYLSDRTLHILPGGRKIWMVFGALLILPCIHFLFIPPETAGATYFAVWSFALYLAWTMMVIPYNAWGAELSRGYHERTKIVTFRAVANEMGSLVFLGGPIILVFLGLVNTTEFSLHTISYAATALFVLLPMTIIPLLLFVPKGVTQSLTVSPQGLMDAVRSVRRNKPLLIFLAIFLMSEIGYGMFSTLLFLYIDSYLQIGAKFTYIFAVAVLFSILSFPVWMAVSRRLNKIRTWTVSWLATGFSFFLLLLVPQGEAGFWPAMICISVSMALNGAGLIVAPSVLGDIVDYDTLKTGGHRAGNYFALHAMAVKMVTALGSGMAFFVLGLFNYSVQAPQTNSPDSRFGMMFSLVIMPAFFRLVSVGLLQLFPLNARRQDIIRKRLEQREMRAKR